jgi:hypothetical protein
MHNLPTPAYFASDAYGVSSFDSQTYAGSLTTTGSATATGSAVKQVTTAHYLADTGTAVLIFMTLSCVIIFAALLIRFWHKPKLPTADQ